ncbi:sugar ABC transporter permease [Desemzia sp. RIT804]|uniref:carbohydrate ABC transporter permease n=1 Tax=Desemzia sp. RIT 804 TaxID=2810209 RepID=UPI0019516090|nr:sugar ABC transporter permease [Desemzia sp. RIT 804]MBM6614301.1 sugar ABC transporter permease [Desemzia sp. RIT 804]
MKPPQNPTETRGKNKKIKRRTGDSKIALAFLLPTIILLAGLVLYPMIENIRISFFDVPLNPNLDEIFLGLKNYQTVLTDPDFYRSLGVTVLYTALTVVGSTVLGLGVAMLFNREFRFRKLSRSIIILSYVTPSISLVFAWQYMFNNTYGIINHWLVDVTGILDKAPLWFDNPASSFVLVTIFAIWRYFPYAFISFLAILQTMDETLYEAAEIDGANAWQKFVNITLPAIRPVLITIVTLRTIWTFYMFNDVYLLTKQVDVIGVYLYEQAFSQNDMGQAASISVILFVILFTVIYFSRRKVDVANET